MTKSKRTLHAIELVAQHLWRKDDCVVSPDLRREVYHSDFARVELSKAQALGEYFEVWRRFVGRRRFLVFYGIDGRIQDHCYLDTIDQVRAAADGSQPVRYRENMQVIAAYGLDRRKHWQQPVLTCLAPQE